MSMGATSTFRSMQSSVLLAQVLANEFVCSSEALRRTELDAGLGVRATTAWVNSQVPALTSDRAMSKECMKLAQALLSGGLSEKLGE